MCDFISYEIKERYGKKGLLEDEELEQKPELEKVTRTAYYYYPIIKEKVV